MYLVALCRILDGMHSGRLVYDADCAFCSRFAAWSGPAVPWQELELEQVEATVVQVQTAAGWLVDGRVVAWGAPAIAAALIQRGGLAGLAGRALRLPVVRLAADLGYSWVARNRHLMPGGSAECRVRSTGTWSRLLVVGYVLIALVGLISWRMAEQGREAYPALMMPAFRLVPDDADGIFSTEATYTLVMPDGSSRPVTAADVLPSKGSGYAAAVRTLADDRVKSSETAEWLREQLDERATTAGAAKLRVEWHSVRYDPQTRRRTDVGVTKTVTIDLGARR